MSDFKVTCPPVTDVEAVRCAYELERMIGEVMNGKRKAGHLSVEHMVVLIQFARQSANKKEQGEQA